MTLKIRRSDKFIKNLKRLLQNKTVKPDTIYLWNIGLHNIIL
jgi:hypothetical protein